MCSKYVLRVSLSFERVSKTGKARWCTDGLQPCIIRIGVGHITHCSVKQRPFTWPVPPLQCRRINGLLGSAVPHFVVLFIVFVVLLLLVLVVLFVVLVAQLGGVSGTFTQNGLNKNGLLSF